MPFDPHHRKDDDVSRLGLRADMLDAPHQSSPLRKFNYTSHATPSPGGPMSAHAQEPSDQPVGRLSRVHG